MSGAGGARASPLHEARRQAAATVVQCAVRARYSRRSRRARVRRRDFFRDLPPPRVGLAWNKIDAPGGGGGGAITWRDRADLRRATGAALKLQVGRRSSVVVRVWLCALVWEAVVSCRSSVVGHRARVAVCPYVGGRGELQVVLGVVCVCARKGRLAAARVRCAPPLAVALAAGRPAER